MDRPAIGRRPQRSAKARSIMSTSVEGRRRRKRPAPSSLLTACASELKRVRLLVLLLPYTDMQRTIDTFDRRLLTGSLRCRSQSRPRLCLSGCRGATTCRITRGLDTLSGVTNGTTRDAFVGNVLDKKQIVCRNGEYPPIMAIESPWTRSRPFCDMFNTSGPSSSIGSAYSPAVERIKHRAIERTTIEQQPGRRRPKTRARKQMRCVVVISTVLFRLDLLLFHSTINRTTSPGVSPSRQVEEIKAFEAGKDEKGGGGGGGGGAVTTSDEEVRAA